MPDLKNMFFYLLCGGAALATVNQLIKLPELIQALKKEAPECTKPNP